MAYSPCNQLCNNTVGSFSCDCVQGYRLSNKTACEATGKPLIHMQHLFFSDIKKRPTSLLKVNTVQAKTSVDARA